MRKRARLLALECSFDMTPMIDVTFQLIIFFMLTLHLTALESIGEVTLPEAEEARRPTRVDPHRIVVTILPSGTYLVAGEAVSLEELRQLLRQEVEAARSAGRPLPSVCTRADREAPYGSLRLVMRECVALGLRRFSFACQPPLGKELMEGDG